ncbi:MAG: ribonuclease III domain-containing protein [Opitutaceae bacterium]
MNEQRTKAWIGDAVLALFAREWILKQSDIASEKRAEVFIQMTSNKFLSALGEPTAMEAEIGVVYDNDGLQAAFDHIEAKFIPIFQKQRNNQRKPGSYRRKS